jgi:peptidoglycan/LPS O-acetylase OafA/YrhL
MLGLQTILVPSFGDNFALWSLANETWYYVLFPLLVVVFHGRTIAARGMAVLAVVAIVQLVGGAIVLYFSIWLLGAAFSRVRIDGGPALRWGWLVLFVGSAIVIRIKGSNDTTPASYPQYLLFGLVLALLLSSLQSRRSASPIVGWLERSGRFFASFSFTLYVLHLPLIAVLVHVMSSRFGLAQLSPLNPSHYLVFIGMYVSLVAGAYVFYLPFEANTYRVRRWLKLRLLARSALVSP